MKKINEMTTKELSIYISNRIQITKTGLIDYNELFNNEIVYFQNTNNQNNSINDLRTCAYKIKDVSEHAQWNYNKQIMIKGLINNVDKKPKRGEIWTCELGKNVGSEENKTRPVIIIQNNTGNEKSPTTIIVPISNRPKKIAVHIEIKNKDYEIVDGEIEEIKGTILCEQIKVVSKARLGRHIATLNDDFIKKILNSKLENSILKE